MNRSSWTLVVTLALPPLTLSGCKDSNQNYIGFDAAPEAPASDAKGDANANDAPIDAVASDTPTAADAGTDAVAPGDADDVASPDLGPDTEPGQ